MTFPTSGLVRLSQIIAPDGPVPVSRSTWWAGVKAGRFPSPVKLSAGVTCWKAEEVNLLMEHGPINAELSTVDLASDDAVLEALELDAAHLSNARQAEQEAANA